MALNAKLRQLGLGRLRLVQGLRLRLLIRLATIGENAPVGNNSEVVRSVMDWARGRLGEELCLASLSARAGYSAHHFSRLFAASVGLAPAEWIERERIAAAERLLAGSRLRILDIALECGFNDAATFSRAFSRVAGLPGLLWSRLPREAAAAGLLPERPEYYQLAFWEESAEDAFSCLAGFGSLSPSPPLPFVSSSLPPCVCLVCTVRGPVERIGAAYAEIYGSILPKMTERPALNFALERYPADGEPEICLPLRLAR